ASDAAVCGNGSLLTHVTESPALIVRSAGANCVASIATVCVAGFLLTAGRSALHAAESAALNRISTSAMRIARLPSVPAAGQRPLQLLRVLEVRDERWPHLDQQRLQLGVLRPGNERRVERVEHLLVIGGLVVDVRLVEGRAAERPELREVVVPSLAERLRGRV